MKTIVALADFSDVLPKVLDEGGKIATAFNAHLVILHGVPSQVVVMDMGLASPTIHAKSSSSLIEAEYEKLLDLRDSLKDSGTKVTLEQLEPGDVKTTLHRCKGLEADMIIEGAHHHSALYELFIGRFTGDVLKLATCPVLVVPAEIGTQTARKS